MSRDAVGIFVATMTGLSELCAEEISGVLSAAGFENEIHLMDGLDQTAVADKDVVIIVSSTYGHGDIPDNGQGFYEALKASGDLTGKKFAVFGLGDRTYSETFCNAGVLWDECLAARGGTRIVPLFRHDASAGTFPEDVAIDWAQEWVPSIKKAA